VVEVGESLSLHPLSEADEAQELVFVAQMVSDADRAEWLVIRKAKSWGLEQRIDLVLVVEEPLRAPGRALATMNRGTDFVAIWLERGLKLIVSDEKFGSEVLCEAWAVESRLVEPESIAVDVVRPELVLFGWVVVIRNLSQTKVDESTALVAEAFFYEEIGWSLPLRRLLPHRPLPSRLRHCYRRSSM